ncbi:hypothetical protein BRC74_02600 [Halobacteriales archaeon QH_7_68_42]|nr:MAG: hypothetical protein BRC74_02600 [Halobacteriales archaeon QH_7_68_42]
MVVTLGPLASSDCPRFWQQAMKALGPLATRECRRDPDHSLKALGPLAVAEPDILLRSAQSDSACSDA